MKTKTKRTLAMYVALGVVIVALIVDIFLLFKNPLDSIENDTVGVLIKICAVANLISLIVAWAYIGTEFKKSSAKFFKLFLYTVALSYLTHYVPALVNNIMPVGIIFFTMICFGLLCVLTVANDLGKVKSLVLSYLCLVWNIFVMIYATIKEGKFTGDFNYFLHSSIVLICLSIVLVIMMHLKYYDKMIRKTN